MNDVMKMIAGLDIGNGYVKGTIEVDGGEPSVVDFLSGVAIETNSAGLKVKGNDIPFEIDNIYNTMEASFDSPAVESRTSRLFGQRGVRSGKAMEEFDVASTISKAQQDLSGILVLGSLAGKALQAFYEKHHTLPSEVVQVDARIAVALPITEYKTQRKMYIEKFRGKRHMVSVHNFENTVRIEILVSDVQVLAEGASAQYAIVSHGEPLMNALLEDLHAHGEAMEGITAADILAAENTIGIDIGEGTVNFPVFQDGRFNPDVSITFSKGYGTILEQARERLQIMNMQYPSRKALADFMLSTPNALNKARRNRVQQVVVEEIEGFVQELCLQLRKVISRVGAYTEVVYVYGGGANPVKEQLYPALLNMMRQFGGEDVSYPILYLDSTYSRHLNREGLFIVAKEVAAQQAAQAKKVQTVQSAQ